MIGTLEDLPRDVSTQTYEARVRPLFIRKGIEKWRAVTEGTIPSTIGWDACFHGRGEGGLTSIGKPSANPVPPHILRDSDVPPWRTRRSLDFAGSVGLPVYRPIILSSSMTPSCKDPLRWRMVGSGKIKTDAKKLLSAVVLARPEMQANDLKVAQLYQSKSGEQLVFIGPVKKLKTEAQQGNDVFAVGANGEWTYLGSHLQFVDSGDFDSDGRTEIVMKKFGDQKEGYVLFVGSEPVAESSWPLSNLTAH
jgi:hypothetical protein